jgi:hypothetical protein
MVAAAIQGKVDCVDYISHFRLGLSSMVFEHKTNKRASFQHRDGAHSTGKGRSGFSGSRKLFWASLHGIAELTRTKRFPRSRQKKRVRTLVELFSFPKR